MLYTRIYIHQNNKVGKKWSNKHFVFLEDLISRQINVNDQKLRQKNILNLIL